MVAVEVWVSGGMMKLVGCERTMNSHKGILREVS